MGGIRDKIAATIPWIEPVLDYFDWRKRLVAFVLGLFVAGWSFVKDLPWPIIFFLGFGTLVLAAYALVFPAFIKLINVGVDPRPNYAIWRHRKQFRLYEAACLLADREPVRNPAQIGGDAAAWFGALCEAIRMGEISHMPTMYDGQHTFEDGYRPYTETVISAGKLKKFSAARKRHPEFLE